MILFRDKMEKPLTSKQASVKIMLRVYHYYLDFILFMLTLVGTVPSHLFRLFCYRLAGIKIGKGSRIHMWARFYQPKGITIGNDTIIGDHAFFDGRAPLIIGNHVAVASNVMIYNSEHDFEDESFSAREEPVYIKDYVFIGPRVTILPGVTIGKGAIIGAGAVVTKNVSEFTMVGGIPAKPIGERKNRDLHYRLGRARLFQ